jgi:hypothetical protein
MRSERARVLITVKASPEPSKSYGDTVCVAGVRLNEDGSGSWVRIYPVAFRHLDTDQQFKKFEVIEVDLVRSTKDARAESFRPNWDTLSRQKKGGDFKTYPMDARGLILNQLIGPTTCELRAGVEADLNAQSLGLGVRNEKVRTYFFVGNFGDIVKRKNFSVLGVYRPGREADYGATLF